MGMASNASLNRVNFVDINNDCPLNFEYHVTKICKKVSKKTHFD